MNLLPVYGAVIMAFTSLGAEAAVHTTPMLPPCEVSGDIKQLASAGGAKAVCAAIAKVSLSRGSAPFSVAVLIRPRAQVVATVTLAGGKRLPAIEVAEMDRGISAATLQRLARLILDQVASEAK